MIYIPEVFMSLGFLIILIISVFVKRNQNIVLGYLSLLLIFLTQLTPANTKLLQKIL